MLATSEQLAKLPVEQVKEKRRIYNDRYRLQKEALKKFRDEWLKEDYYNSISALTDLKVARDRSIIPGDKDFRILRPFLPERARVADLADRASPLYSTARRFAVEDLILLYTEADHRVLYRPGDHPVEGRCSVR